MTDILITDELLYQCWTDIKAMQEDQRAELDPISRALDVYKRRHPDERWSGTIIPNRIVALLAVKIMEAHDTIMWERD